MVENNTIENNSIDHRYSIGLLIIIFCKIHGLWFCAYI